MVETCIISHFYTISLCVERVFRFLPIFNFFNHALFKLFPGLGQNITFNLCERSGSKLITIPNSSLMSL